MTPPNAKHALGSMHSIKSPSGAPLRRSDSLPSIGGSLSRAQSGTLGNTQLLSFADSLLGLGEDEFDVARVGHVRVDTTVGAVGSAALLGGLVDLDVLDDELRGVEAFGVGVGFRILQQAEEELGGLDGVTGLGDTELLACKSRR